METTLLNKCLLLNGGPGSGPNPGGGKRKKRRAGDTAGGYTPENEVQSPAELADKPTKNDPVPEGTKSAYKVPSIDGMRKDLAAKGISTSHISTARSLVDQRKMLKELADKHGITANSTDMETITLNRSIGRTRRETLGGRDYIVAPLSMLVPGVLNGSRGPLLYPPELVNRNPAVWNHMPIVVYHPMELGKPTSARDPYILNKQGIGFVFKSRENGRAEGWFDVENTKRVDPRVYDALVKNQPMELSTGLFTKNQKAPSGSSFRGKKYVEVVKDFTPDHLAILPDQKGACSMKDGCGMLINKETGEGLTLETPQRKSKFRQLIEGLSELVENFNPSQPRDSQGRWSGGGGGGSSGGKSSGGMGGGPSQPSGAAKGLIKDVELEGKTVPSATAVELPDFTIGGNLKTRTNLLGDYTHHAGQQGNIVHIDPAGEHLTLKTKAGEHVKLSTSDTSQRDAELKKFKQDTGMSHASVEQYSQAQRQELIQKAKAKAQAKSGASTDSHETVKQMQKKGNTTKRTAAQLKGDKKIDEIAKKIDQRHPMDIEMRKVNDAGKVQSHISDLQSKLSKAEQTPGTHPQVISHYQNRIEGMQTHLSTLKPTAKQSSALTKAEGIAKPKSTATPKQLMILGLDKPVKGTAHVEHKSNDQYNVVYHPSSGKVMARAHPSEGTEGLKRLEKYAEGKQSKMLGLESRPAKTKIVRNQEGSQFGKPHDTVKEMPNMAKQRKQVNNEEVELTDDDREELIDLIVDNCACEEAQDRETLNSLSDKTLSKLALNAVPPQFMKKKAAAEEEEEEVDDEEEVPVKNSKNKKAVTVNSQVKLDAKTQFLVNYAERKMQEEKDALIEKLTANVSEEDMDDMVETLNEEPIEKLERMVKLLPKAEKREPVQNNRNQRGRSSLREEVPEAKGRNFTGAGGALPKSQARQVNNSRNKADDEDPLAGPLESPTINYADVAGFQNGNFIHRNNLGSMQASAN